MLNWKIFLACLLRLNCVHCVRQVKSRVAVLNQKYPERTIWKESAICTKTWNSSVLQLIDVSPPTGSLPEVEQVYQKNFTSLKS